MKPIPTHLHAVLDYAVGLSVILMPWLFKFADGSSAQWVPVICGCTTIVLALLTKYEGGLIRLIC